METYIATNIQQSKRLLDAGVESATADMYWLCLCEESKDNPNYWSLRPIEFFSSVAPKFSDTIIPAWSAGKLWRMAEKTYGGPVGVCCQVENLIEQLIGQLIIWLKVNPGGNFSKWVLK